MTFKFPDQRKPAIWSNQEMFNYQAAMEVKLQSMH